MDQPHAGLGFREVMRRFPTGVTVVAALDPEGEPIGLTVNSFTSVSLDPPLVLVCIGSRSASHDRLIEAGRFSVNVLSTGQVDLALRFAGEPSQRRFEDVAWHVGPNGCPLLEGATAWLACSLEQVVPGGDHSILVARSVATGVSDEPAMVFHAGAFGSVGR